MDKKKEYDSPQEPQRDAQSEAAPLERPAAPPSFREVYERSPYLNSVIIPTGKLLGYGTHSDVYLGELAGSGQRVVIRVDRRPIRSTRTMRSQFNAVQNKVNRFKKLKHPGIAELVDWIPDWENNRSYITGQ